MELNDGASTTETVDSSQTAPSLDAIQNVETKTESVSASSAPTTGEVIPTQPVYQPNYKFKVLDKEMEIPEQFRAAIKDAETEKQAREIFEKAHGLDHVKRERGMIRDEYKQFRAKAEPLLKVADEFNYYRQIGDLGSAMSVLGLSKADVYKWAVKQAELEELNPEQRRVYDEREEMNRRLYMAEQEAYAREQQLQNFQVQQRHVELQSALVKPDVQTFVSAFDQRNGQDAFKQEVIARGNYYWSVFQKDVPADAIVSELVQKYGAFFQSQQQAVAQQTTQGHASTPKAPAQVPVIPNTGSSSMSAAKRKVSSLEDIEREYQSL